MRLTAIFVLLFFATSALSQTKPVVTGNPSVSVEGKGAATAGDVTSGGTAVTGGSTNVFIGGNPAATVGDKTACGGTVITGSSSVFINGKPMATAGSQATDCNSQ
jgi:uncharacterized Zn-binding protein involved in type VI secretion